MKSKLHLQDLPKETTYILLERKYEKRLFENFSGFFKNSSKAGEYLHVQGHNIKTWKRKNHYIPLWTMPKIIKFLDSKGQKYTIKDIEKRTVACKYKGGRAIFNPKFPINFNSKEGAIIAAAFLCDGGINQIGDPLYNNSEYCMRKRVVDAINNLVGEIHVDPSKPHKNNCLWFPRILKSILVTELNMQIGDKVMNNPKIPDIFLSTNKREVIGEFLNQAFSDDGTAYISAPHNQGSLAYGSSICVSNHSKELTKKIKKEKLIAYAPNLVKGCKILLEKLEIKANGPYLKQEYVRRKGGKNRIVQSWSIQIQGRKNIKKYRKFVGFSIEKKNKRVEDILNNYKEIDYGTSLKDAWQKVVELEKENKKITPRTFMEKRACTLGYARFLLKWLRKEGVIKRSGGGHRNGLWGCAPYEYKIINHRIKE